MNYLSVCSGIEAATVAWRPLGWEAAAFAEIDPFCRALLAHHYPETPNLGDLTRYEEWQIKPGAVDVLVGGTPCQSFSISGRRGGLADARGRLMLSYLGVARQLRPRWVLWENVPGVLSSGRGRDFGALLQGLVRLGYGLAWRVLDAQYFGLAQRRKRVFVVGSLGGGWSGAAAVLFDGESLRRGAPPRRQTRDQTGTEVARCLRGNGFDASCDGSRATLITYTLRATRGQNATETLITSEGIGVRRLSPTEFERLQGFADGYTLVPYRKGLAKDSPRYKALGNSMATPVVRWIGRRIQWVDGLLGAPAARERIGPQPNGGEDARMGAGAVHRKERMGAPARRAAIGMAAIAPGAVAPDAKDVPDTTRQ